MEALNTILGLGMMAGLIRGSVLLFMEASAHKHAAKWIYIATGIASLLCLVSLIYRASKGVA